MRRRAYVSWQIYTHLVTHITLEVPKRNHMAIVQFQQFQMIMLEWPVRRNNYFMNFLAREYVRVRQFYAICQN